MYKIFVNNNANRTKIFDAREPLDWRCLSPTLSLEANSAGTLTMTMTPGGIGYGTLSSFTTYVEVWEEGANVPTWDGRVLDLSEDFYGQQSITCEGAMSYLTDVYITDSIAMPPNTVYATNYVLDIYNNACTGDRAIKVGSIVMLDISLDKQTNKSCFDILKAIADETGGIFYITYGIEKIEGHDTIVRYLNFTTKDYMTGTSKQTIEFGANLLNFTKAESISNLCTWLAPLGKSTTENDVTKYTNIKSVNDGSEWLIDVDLYNMYGKIMRTIEFNDIESPATLKELGKKFFAESVYKELTYTVNGVDLHLTKPNVQPIKCLDLIEIKSKPHNVDIVMPVMSCTIALDDPGASTFELSQTVQRTMTADQRDLKAGIAKELQISTDSILTEALDNAGRMILSATTGYITIEQKEDAADALYISNTKDYKVATNFWVWNQNGLGHFKKGVNEDPSANVAITMDGQIVANFITAGQMSADRIYGGTYTAGGQANQNGTISIRDASNSQKGIINNEGLAFYGAGNLYSKLTTDAKLSLGDADYSEPGIQIYGNVGLAGANECVGVITGKTIIFNVSKSSGRGIWVGEYGDDPQSRITMTKTIKIKDEKGGTHELEFLHGFLMNHTYTDPPKEDEEEEKTES